MVFAIKGLQHALNALSIARVEQDKGSSYWKVKAFSPFARASRPDPAIAE